MRTIELGEDEVIELESNSAKDIVNHSVCLSINLKPNEKLVIVRCEKGDSVELRLAEIP